MCYTETPPTAGHQAVCMCAWGTLISTYSVGNAGDCFINCSGLVVRDFTAGVDRVWPWVGEGICTVSCLSSVAVLFHSTWLLSAYFPGRL